MTARGLAAPLGRPVRRWAIGARMRGWPAHSRLFVPGDGHDWAIADDARALRGLAADLGIRLGPETWVSAVRNQSVFHASQFGLFGCGWRHEGNRIGVAYLHGRPGTPGMPEFDVCYDELRDRHEELDRVQVSCRAMEELVLGTGIAPEKVFRIPIGVDLPSFPLRDSASRAAARHALGFPKAAFVAGSFQKDGVGWDYGLEPKLIKGPDVLLTALERLRQGVPELHVLLTGPARGYVRQGLERLGIPYRHAQPAGREGLAEAYRALDVYLVASRDEGGPKAVLEAMASGVPLVSTRVGQAADLVEDGVNGSLVEVEDPGGLAARALDVARGPQQQLERLVHAGRQTAERTSYEALRPRWRDLFDGFVAIEGEE